VGTLRAMTVGRPLLEYLRRTDGPLFGCGPWRFGPLPVMARRYSSRPDQNTCSMVLPLPLKAIHA